MPDASSVEGGPPPPHRPSPRAFAGLSPARQLAMLLANGLPLGLLLSALALACLLPAGWGLRLGAGLAWLYLLPPLLNRLLWTLWPRRATRLPVTSGAFLVWWLSACLQTLFSRLPVLEEALRLCPGLYSTWLRLWGARVGRRTYWAPGVTILDRSFIIVGDDVVFGSGVRLNPHVLDRDEAGQWWLLLAPIVIGDRCLVGGYSLLTAGTEIAADEVSTATVLSPPFSYWQGGKRHRSRPPGPT